ncbi:hypothetical protein NIES4106_23140 [Fischerella sp. NIES-4106]|nr:hypothetical protein NIES4106_23140 [Fischerella sp. NIES-4106]
MYRSYRNPIDTKFIYGDYLLLFTSYFLKRASYLWLQELIPIPKMIDTDRLIEVGRRQQLSIQNPKSKI